MCLNNFVKHLTIKILVQPSFIFGACLSLMFLWAIAPPDCCLYALCTNKEGNFKNEATCLKEVSQLLQSP